MVTKEGLEVFSGFFFHYNCNFLRSQQRAQEMTNYPFNVTLDAFGKPE